MLRSSHLEKRAELQRAWRRARPLPSNLQGVYRHFAVTRWGWLTLSFAVDALSAGQIKQMWVRSLVVRSEMNQVVFMTPRCHELHTNRTAIPIQS